MYELNLGVMELFHGFSVLGVLFVKYGARSLGSLN